MANIITMVSQPCSNCATAARPALWLMPVNSMRSDAATVERINSPPTPIFLKMRSPIKRNGISATAERKYATPIRPELAPMPSI